MIGVFGSEVNGLVASLTSYLGFFHVMEGGLGSVIAASLYKPLKEGDSDKISSIIKTGQNFYKKLAFLTFMYTLLVAIVYPFFIKTSFDFVYIFSLTILLSLGNVINFYFAVAKKYLIYADCKNYILMGIQIIVVIVNLFAVILSMRIYPSIHFIKFVTLVVYLLNPLLSVIYANKEYKIKNDSKINDSLLSQRWDGFSHNLSIYISDNIDYVLLSIFSTLSNISVYSVYSLIVGSIKNIIISISSAISPFMGKSYATKTDKKMDKSFLNNYKVITFISIVLFSSVIFLLDDFIMLYTAGVYDADYHQSLFGFILVLCAIVDSVKDVYLQITITNGEFKSLRKLGYGEVLVNLLVSILLINRFGLVGIALGTLISKIYRFITQLIYLKNSSYIESGIKEFGKFVFILLIIMLLVYINKKIIFIKIIDYLTWVLSGFISVTINFSITYVIYKIKRNLNK